MNAPSPSARLPDPRSSAAVLVGCADYAELPALPAVSAGLADLRTALTDPTTGGFTADTCQVIAEPTDPGRLARVLLEAARTTLDTLLVYYAGHGVLDEDNNLHLALNRTSTDQALVPDTALPFARVRSILRASPATNRIVILDCCFAGRAIHDMSGPDLSTRAVISGSYVLTATDADKTARAPGGARHTAFTGALLDLLHGGIPDGPDLLTLEAIYPHLRHCLLGQGLPEPRRQGTDTAAGLALTRNPAARPVPVPVPVSLGARLALSEPVALGAPAAQGEPVAMTMGEPAAVAVPVAAGEPVAEAVTPVDAIDVLTKSTHRPEPELQEALELQEASSRRFIRRVSRKRLLLAVAGLLVVISFGINYARGDKHDQGLDEASQSSPTPASSSQRHIALSGPVRVLTGHSEAVSAVAYAPGGKSLATGSDKILRIWNPVTGKPLRSFSKYSDGSVTALAYAPNGATLAVATANPPSGFPFFGGGHSAKAAASYESTLRLWDPARGVDLNTLTDRTNRVAAMAYAPDGKAIATAGSDGTIYLTNARTDHTLSDKAAQIWSTATGKRLKTLAGFKGSVTSVAYAPDGKTLATAGADQRIRIWNPSTGKKLKTLVSASGLTAIAYAPDGKTLAAAGTDAHVRIWNVTTGTVLKTLAGHSNSVTALAWAPDGTSLATGSDDTTVLIWNPADGKRLTTLSGHSGGVTALAWAPDGATLATGSNDKTVRLWPLR